MLEKGDDLRALAEKAVAEGADALGMAGGDGSQAVVASVAAARGVPFICIPTGTRNHLALDLGLDRDHPLRALGAFGAARECLIDLAEVNGEVFVNNVSLGVYARIVASDEYREAKGRTVAELLPAMLGPGAPPFGLTVDGPARTGFGCLRYRDLEQPLPADQHRWLRVTTLPGRRQPRSNHALGPQRLGRKPAGRH